MTDGVKNGHKPGQEWWRGAVIYQIYPRSFRDASGDGVGDLKGISEKLDYIAGLGVDAIWLSPFFKSPMKDYGYDVADYCDVDPLFGTLDDFRHMLDKAHGLGLKIIIDFVLTHSSDQHAWFQESRSSRDNPRADWYVWADPKPDGTPPNNWQAHFGGPSWTFDIRRGQYYFHNFLPEQPDINLRSPGARQAIFDAARFWLNMGVDGFRLDAALHYFCDPSLKDNPPNPNPSTSWFDHPTPFAMQIHENDIHVPDTLAFMEELRALLDQYGGRMAVAEIGGEHGVRHAAAYTDGPRRIHTAYNFSLISGDRPSAAKIRGALEEFSSYPGKGWPSWAFSNHDVVRVASRWHADKDGYHHDPRLSRVLIALLGALYGTIFLYQGEELGLPEARLSFEDLQDPWGKYLYPVWQGRDGCRTPMPWAADAPHAGFGTGTPWLPIPAAHRDLAVDRQERDTGSSLLFTRAFLQWRKGQPALRDGTMTFIDTGDDTLLAFRRGDDGDGNIKAMLCVFNLADREARLGRAALAGGATLSGGASLFTAAGQDGHVDGETLILPPYGFFFSFG